MNTDNDLQLGQDSEEDFAELVAALKEEQEAMDPGPVFFEALHDDIMRQIASPAPEGHFETPAPASGEEVGSWLDKVRAFFSLHPTALGAVAMAVALLAIVFWPKTHGQGPSIVLDAGQAVAVDAGTNKAGYDPTDGLDKDARQEALALAEAIELDIDLDSEDDDWDALADLQLDDDLGSL